MPNRIAHNALDNAVTTVIYLTLNNYIIEQYQHHSDTIISQISGFLSINLSSEA